MSYLRNERIQIKQQYMKLTCTIIIVIFLCLTLVDTYCSSLYASFYDVLFPLVIALFVDCYQLMIAKWLIVGLYGILILTYLVSWTQKLL